MAPLMLRLVASIALSGSGCHVGLGVSRSVSAMPEASSSAASDAPASRPAMLEASTASPDTASDVPSAEPPGDLRAVTYRSGMPYHRGVRTLRGLTIAQAKQRLKELGHTGKVDIEESSYADFDPPCEVGTVCGYHGGTDPDEDIVLHVVKAKLDITSPAP